MSRAQQDIRGEEAETDLDTGFYVLYYPDLKDLTPSQARRHYMRYGRSEGRFASPTAFMSDLTDRFGPAPADFDADTYRALNEDLVLHTHDWQLTEHYIRFGQAEGRKYKLTYPLMLTQDDYRALAREGCRSFPDESELVPALLARSGLPAGMWLTRFVLLDFTLLNRAWLGVSRPCLVEALKLFASEGIERLAPIARGCYFDPPFYRNQCVELASKSDAELYRHWLLIGIQRGITPNEDQFVDRLLGLSGVPDCFDDQEYRRAAEGKGRNVEPGRMSALRDFVEYGFEAGLARPASGGDAGGFYEAVGDYHIVRGNVSVAHDAYDAALRSNPEIGHLRHKRGDAFLILGDKAQARSDFEAAAAQPNASMWSYLHAAELRGESADFESAFRLLRDSADKFGHSENWRSSGHALLCRFFDRRVNEARARYRAGDRGGADRIIEDASRFVADTIPWLDPLPAPMPPCRSDLVVILANRDLEQCDHYRVTQKRQQLEHAGWRVEIYEPRSADAFRSALTRASDAIFYRVPAIPAVVHAILTARELGVRTVYEIDDLVFDPADYPEPFAHFEGEISPDLYVELQVGVPLFRFAMGLCDVGLASTPTLAEAMRPIVRSGVCHLLRNGLDRRNAPYLARDRVDATDGTVTLFYGSGTKAHNRDFSELLSAAILSALDRHDRVRLVVAGHVHLDARFVPYLSRIHRFEFTPDIDAYWELLGQADINLAVLSPGRMTDAKSEIKWLEAAMLGIPSIVSPTRTYREILRDGHDVSFAATPAEWVRSLEDLIADPTLRRQMGERARRKACAEYSLEAADFRIRALLGTPSGGNGRRAAVEPTSGAARPRAFALSAAPDRRRIMIVNVFQPPAMFGGATRVVRENVDFLIEHAADWLDIILVGADETTRDPSLTRVDQYRGVPVFRIPTSATPVGDWRPFDDMVEELFDECLDRTLPDLIHFHCVQKLTASVVKSARDRNIPYLVTLHDAWWISDYQFLCDPQGRIHHPGQDAVSAIPPPSIGKTAAVARRVRLDPLLRGARAALAVSAPFADIYRAAGHEDVTVLSNGCSKIPVEPRTLSPGGRLRVAYLGGRGLHKGGSLVEIAFREGRFRNVELTVVDDAQPAHHDVRAVWGATPVRIVGSVPQDRMPELYSKLDVLLAPSIWPESFGLVAREARQAGLWIVASDRGAIGQEVQHGIDGFIVDVDSLDSLAAALAVMDRDPRAILDAPRPIVTPRTSDDQGAELLALYRDLLGIGREEQATPFRTGHGRPLARADATHASQTWPTRGPARRG